MVHEESRILGQANRWVILLAKLKKKDEKNMTDKDTLGHSMTVFPLTRRFIYYKMPNKDK